MRIVYLPLDSRPCNSLFPVQLAAWCGHECIIPEPCEMDDFVIPAAFEDSCAFLERSLPAADAAVLSVDHLCYGSLLGSREDSAGCEEALRRLQTAEKLHMKHPELPIDAYGVIMRSSISTLYAEDVTAYRAMTEYSVYSDRAEQTGAPADKARAQAALEQLPPKVLARYQLARKRNHAVNLRCVELAGSGVFRALALLQEDSEEWGFHKGEQRALLKRRQELGATNVWLHNGADEGGALAVMKAAAAGKQLPGVKVCYLGWPEGRFTARYEDRPFCENTADSMSFAGMRQEENAEDVLAVCCPPDGLQTDWENPAYAEAFSLQAESIARMAADGKRVYLLDVTRANGGSAGLIRELHSRMPVSRLAGYSAWNTASNSLGTMLAQIISDQLAGKVNQAFLWERLIDDLAYQGAVRAQLNEWLQENGEDPFRLKNRKKAEEQLRLLMNAYLNSEPCLQAAPAYRIALPWDRTFECLVQAGIDTQTRRIV